MYKGFASVYDELMADAPYSSWLTWVETALKEEQLQEPKILEVGCGTGTILASLCEKGYQAEGLDMSEDMLAVADQKLKNKGLQTLLTCQDMRYFDMGKQFDVIIVLCDSLNYLTSINDMEKALKTIWDHLRPGGKLLFDVHSLYYMKNVLSYYSVSDAAEDISYIWNVFPTDTSGEVEHELTIFTQRQDSLYMRYDELHRQRAYSMDDYRSVIKKCGFSIKRITADFTSEAPVETSERLFFNVEKILQNP